MNTRNVLVQGKQIRPTYGVQKKQKTGMNIPTNIQYANTDNVLCSLRLI